MSLRLLVVVFIGLAGCADTDAGAPGPTPGYGRGAEPVCTAQYDRWGPSGYPMFRMSSSELMCSGVVGARLITCSWKLGGEDWSPRSRYMVGPSELDPGHDNYYGPGGE